MRRSKGAKAKIERTCLGCQAAADCPPSPGPGGNRKPSADRGGHNPPSTGVALHHRRGHAHRPRIVINTHPINIGVTVAIGILESLHSNPGSSPGNQNHSAIKCLEQQLFCDQIHFLKFLFNIPPSCPPCRKSVEGTGAQHCL